MNPIDRNKIWKMVGILALITVVAGGLLRVSQHSSYTLGDYATDNPSLAYQTSELTRCLSSSCTPSKFYLTPMNISCGILFHGILFVRTCQHIKFAKEGIGSV